MRHLPVLFALILAGLSRPGVAQVAAPGHEALCAELESTRPGEFVYGENGPYLTASTVRPSHELPSVGRSVIKGAMARKLSSELGDARVRWSSALLKGPLTCGGYHAFQILVDPTHVRITEQ